jgi:TRAP-type C4-dicarboxylate transport system permease small subunit
MPVPHELDHLELFESKETKHHLPLGFLVLYFGLIAWGVYYLWSMWSWRQGAALDAPDTASGWNLFATILFTALPTLAAIVIVLQRRKAPHPPAPLSARGGEEAGAGSKRT